MDLKKPFYYCSECKKTTHQLDELLFIDEGSFNGFCSEECIEDYYFPLIKHYENVELSLRKKHQVELENNTQVDPAIIEAVLENPSEIYRQTNELKESFYHFIKHFPDFTVIVVSSVYRKEASFVFLSVKTKSKALVNEFRFGEQVDWILEPELDGLDNAPAYTDEDVLLHVNEEGHTDNAEDEDMVFIQLLESKKSKLLADILMKIKDSDIPFEDYSGYESCFQETLDSPDEVFEKKDNEGDVIFTYIKSFSNFFYIISCLKRVAPGSMETSVYPIMALPTTDLEMCQEFRGGIKLTGPLKN